MQCLRCYGELNDEVIARSEADNAIARSHDPLFPQLTHGCTCGALMRLTDGKLRFLTEAELFDMWARYGAIMDANELLCRTGTPHRAVALYEVDASKDLFGARPN